MVIRRIEDVPAPTKSRGFVPTMGALHEGHLSLIRASKRENEETVVSVFVNPTQFGPNEDFAKYPRMLERDTELAIGAGADWIFAPTPEEMYPRKTTFVRVSEVTETYEGASRPGHFDGVATVVLKLFNIVRPHRAYFGQKDLQQCAVIRRMVEDLNVPLKLSIEPTLREADGLAMSSRNAYLSPQERATAPLIYATLIELRDRLRDGADSAALEDARRRLSDSGFVLDYLDLLDSGTMQPTKEVGERAAIAVAARLGSTRLIDNLLLYPNAF